jgi:hypothetical protein
MNDELINAKFNHDKLCALQIIIIMPLHLAPQECHSNRTLLVLNRLNFSSGFPVGTFPGLLHIPTPRLISRLVYQELRT